MINKLIMIKIIMLYKLVYQFNINNNNKKSSLIIDIFYINILNK